MNEEKCYVLKINQMGHFLFWAENSSGYTEKLSEAGIYDLTEFRKKRSENSIPFIDSIKKYESIDVSHHHSIIIPIYLLQVLGYVDFVFKSTDLKHPKRRNETDES
jgi:hypothetical protein